MGVAMRLPFLPRALTHSCAVSSLKIATAYAHDTMPYVASSFVDMPLRLNNESWKEVRPEPVHFPTCFPSTLGPDVPFALLTVSSPSTLEAAMNLATTGQCNCTVIVMRDILYLHATCISAKSTHPFSLDGSHSEQVLEIRHMCCQLS